MAFGNSQLTKTDLFVKSSIADLQDPVFLTFEIDFFPVSDDYPRYDGLYNSNLLIPPADVDSLDKTFPTRSRPPVEILGGGGNQTVEYSACDWLDEYYGPNYAKALSNWQPHPGKAMRNVITGLLEVQSSPWYFSSIQGIGDLWKQSYRVKEGDNKATLTFNCLESIRQPLTRIAENYTWAVYDSDRRAYRLPDNLRWFDMEIKLIEARNLVDHARNDSIISFGRNDDLKLFQRDSAGNVTKGIKVISFRCKMCEFDFSEFLSPAGVTEFTAATPDKAFSPSFKVNVGWVIHEEMLDTDAELIRKSSLLTGALNALSNRLSNTLSVISNVPNAIVGSVANRIQTIAENRVIGNVYDPDVISRAAGAATDFASGLTGRRPPVGPILADLRNTRVYPQSAPAERVNGTGIGDAYSDPEKPKRIQKDDLNDVYADPVPPTPVRKDGLDDVY
jgi:hypothetical protein